jgi:hypothetical protein
MPDPYTIFFTFFITNISKYRAGAVEALNVTRTQIFSPMLHLF